MMSSVCFPWAAGERTLQRTFFTVVSNLFEVNLCQICLTAFGLVSLHWVGWISFPPRWTLCSTSAEDMDVSLNLCWSRFRSWWRASAEDPQESGIEWFISSKNALKKNIVVVAVWFLLLNTLSGMLWCSSSSCFCLGWAFRSNCLYLQRLSLGFMVQ